MNDIRISDTTKESFLNSKNRDRDYVTIMNELTRYESEIGKSIINFSLDDCISFLRLLNNKRERLFTRSYTVLEEFYNYLNKEQGITSPNLFTYIDKDEFRDGRINITKRIIPRSLILKYVQGLENARDKFLILAIFEGLAPATLEELLSIQETDIDYKNRTIYVPKLDRTFSISRELAEYAYATSIEERVYTTRSTGVKGYNDVVLSSKYLIKPLKEAVTEKNMIRQSNNASRVSVYRHLTNILKGSIFDGFTYMDLRNSGRIAKIMEQSVYYGMTPDAFLKSSRCDNLMDEFNISSRSSKKKLLDLINTKYLVQVSKE